MASTYLFIYMNLLDMKLPVTLSNGRRTHIKTDIKLPVHHASLLASH